MLGRGMEDFMKFLSGVILAVASSGAVWAQCESDVSVQVERLALSDWQVSYRFDGVFDRFAFLRTGDDYRSARWQVTTPAVTLQRVEDVDYLIAEMPVETITVRFSSLDHPVVYDNQSFLDLGGDARGIYTGQLQVRAVCDDQVGGPEQAPPTHRFDFSSRLEEPVLVHGEPVAPGDTHTFNEQLGAYALYGATPIEVGAGTRIIVADTLPDRMPGVIVEALEGSLQVLASSLEHSLETPPVLMLAERTDVGSGIAFRTGVLDNQIAVEIGGGRLFSDDPNMMGRVDRFVSRLMVHEAVHLWNGGVVTNSEVLESWMHEGSADLLSWLSLMERGLIDQDYFEGRMTLAFNQCASDLENGPLVEALSRGRYNTYYGCGAMMNLVVGHAVDAEDMSRGLFGFWAELIRRGRANEDQTYSTREYFELMDEAGVPASIRAWMDSVRLEQLENPAQVLSGPLETAGWRVENGEDGYRLTLAQ